MNTLKTLFEKKLVFVDDLVNEEDGEYVEYYYDCESDTDYAVIYDLRTNELITIWTIDIDEGELMPIDVLYLKGDNK